MIDVLGKLATAFAANPLAVGLVVIVLIVSAMVLMFWMYRIFCVALAHGADIDVSLGSLKLCCKNSGHDQDSQSDEIEGEAKTKPRTKSRKARAERAER